MSSHKKTLRLLFMTIMLTCMVFTSKSQPQRTTIARPPSPTPTTIETPTPLPPFPPTKVFNLALFFLSLFSGSSPSPRIMIPPPLPPTPTALLPPPSPPAFETPKPTAPIAEPPTNGEVLPPSIEVVVRAPAPETASFNAQPAFRSPDPSPPANPPNIDVDVRVPPLPKVAPPIFLSPAPVLPPPIETVFPPTDGDYEMSPPPSPPVTDDFGDYPEEDAVPPPTV
ncbi:leucine-rich repeat extensin-like protein 3 [Beta vulgaris subsp. vulgaris]|uniref:leucine-rich repeat extensin-like protein 3 n=1 Tax=Beta vulgaris subsp. vulgaris TaxID=3555 RepID=UPI0020371F8E|nr:leucine-rich repeat extensin-like protein 3 [Beta vulgaris subsp. vulgaris]